MNSTSGSPYLSPKQPRHSFFRERVGQRCFALLWGVALAAALPAADVSLTAEDPFGTSSFNSAGNWSNGLAPEAGNSYFTANLTLRTPPTAGSFTFAGDSVSVDAGGRLLGKGGGSSTTQTIIVPDLILNGGTLDQAGSMATTGAVLIVGGNITVQAPSFIGAIGANLNNSPNFEVLEITANLSGTEPLTIAGTSNLSQNRGVVRLSAANSFSGTIDVVDPGFIASATHRLLQLNHLDALRFADLGLYASQPNPLSFAVSANTGTFRVGALAGSAGQALNDTSNQPVTLEVGGTGLSSIYSGSLRGSGNLIKAGTGDLTLQGANTFSGDLTVEGGSLTLDFDAGLNPGTTVSVAEGATLELSNDDAIVVEGLVLGGVIQPAGTYDSGTPGGYLTGPGEIVVSTGDPVPQNISMTADDTFGVSSFNSAGQWSNGQAPSGLNDYFTDGFLLRTPNSAGDFVFAGASLSVDAGSRLLGKGAGVADSLQTITVDDLILNGGSLEQAGTPNPGVVLTVQGAITVQESSVLGALGGPEENTLNFETLDIAATLSGSAALQVAGSANASANRGVVRLSSANDYSGTISVLQPTGITSATHRLLQLNHLDALQAATLFLSTTSPNGLSFAAGANTGAFRVGSLSGTASQTLADTAGAAVTLDVGGNNEELGFFDGVLEGPGTLRKSGTGTWVYSDERLGVATVEVLEGTLELEQPALADDLSISIASGASLHLVHDATDDVRTLILNGVEQPEGTYNASNSGGLITSTGSGAIRVVAATGFDLFMDDFPGLSDVDKHPDADPDGDGIVNLLEYALQGLDPTLPDSLPGLSGDTLVFTKRPAAVAGNDLSYSIEESTTLGVEPDPWAPVSPDINDGTSISFTLPSGAAQYFVRLRVSAVAAGLTP